MITAFKVNKIDTQLNTFLLLIILQVLGVVLLSFELYLALIIFFVVLIFLLSLIQEFWSILFIVFFTVGIEGKWIANEALFKAFGFNWYLMDLGVMVIYTSFLFHFYYGSLKGKQDINSFLILFFVSIALLSALYGVRNGNGLSNSFHDLRAFVYYLVFLPAVFFLKKKQNIRLFIVSFLIIGTLKCAVDSYLSLFVYPTTYDVFNRTALSFARLTGYSEIIYPMIFAISIFIFILSKNFYAKCFLIFAIIISAMALLLSYTRGSWLASSITLIFGFTVLFYTGRLSFNLSAAISGFISIILVFIGLNISGIFKIEHFIDRITSVSFSSIDTSNLGRLIEYKTAFDAFLKNIFFGTGLGFKFSYFAPGIGWTSTTYCHNSYLYIATKMGLVGLVLFLLFIWRIVKKGLVYFKENAESFYGNVVFIASLLIFLVAVKSFTTWHLNTLSFSPFLGLLFGLIIAITNGKNE